MELDGLDKDDLYRILTEPTYNLINQHVANDIRHLLKSYTKTIPTVLEMPSKDQPYDPQQDYIMQRVSGMLNAET